MARTTSGEAQVYYQDLKARAVGYGRDPDTLFILPAAAPVVGSTEAEAEALWRERANLVSIEAALRMLGRSFNDHDFTQYELDVSSMHPSRTSARRPSTAHRAPC